MEKGYVITQEELSELVDVASDGAFSENYGIHTITEIIKDYHVSKSTLISIYFDDILNRCETKEEVDQYIREVIEKLE